MGCGGSKDTTQTVPVRETQKQGGRSPAKSAPADSKRRERWQDSQESAEDDNNNRKNRDNYAVSREEQLRQELVAATDSRDIARLEKAISDYERNQLPNNADLTRARRTLAALHEEELQAAMKDQNLDALEAAIEAANSSEASPELHSGQTLKEAEALRSLLRRLKLYLHKVLELKPMTVSEIHSYKRPRPLVHAVMKATYILLGEQERLLREWEYIQSLLRRQGRGSIIRRIKEFDPQRMKQAKVHRAQGHLQHCSKDKVRQTSAGAGTFYMWSYNIIKEGNEMEGKKS